MFVPSRDVQWRGKPGANEANAATENGIWKIPFRLFIGALTLFSKAVRHLLPERATFSARRRGRV
jgi:hypothetical protein